MRANTSSASRRFGMARGETKPVTSMTGKPTSLRRSTMRTFSAVSMKRGKLCRPSLGPTSATITESGKRIIVRPSEVGVLDGGIGADRLGRALGDHPALREDVEEVADAEHDAHLVV